MSSLLQRLKLGNRLKIVLLKILGRIILSRPFKWVVTPLLYVGMIVWAAAIAFGRTPSIKVPHGSPLSQEMVELVARIEESRKAPVRGQISDRERALVQSLTWGTAGAAVVILVAIATSSKTFGPAMPIAAGCFAVTIPLLIAFGLAHMHQWDAAKAPPTVQECINLIGLIYGGQLLFTVGLAVLLWDFNPRVSIAFLVACYFGARAHKNLVVKRFAPGTIENVTAMIKPVGSGEAHQTAANDAAGAASPDAPGTLRAPNG